MSIQNQLAGIHIIGFPLLCKLAAANKELVSHRAVDSSED